MALEKHMGHLPARADHEPPKNKISRKTGIDIIGDMPWGTHFCQFYQTKQDLIDILVPYIKAGLENNEFCMWVTADNLDEDEAKQALRAAVPDFDRYLERGAILILPYTEWYLDNGEFDRHRVLNSWIEKLDHALAMGFDGARVTGDTMWLNKSHWHDFTDYEESINTVIGDYPLLVLCTYSLDKCGASEVADVVLNHQFALMKRAGWWTIIESADYKHTKDVLRNTLEKLAEANEELHASNDELQLQIKHRMSAEEDLQKLNRTLRAHSKSNQAMMRAADESEYLSEVCKIVVEDCGHAMVWIGFAETDEEKTVRPVAQAGFEHGYLDTLKITWADTERGRGPTGTAIRTGAVSGCRNMLTDPKFAPWREEALRRGYASSLALPIKARDKTFGAITIYSREPNAFTEDEVSLLAVLADDIAYGVTAIRHRAAHARAEGALRLSEERYRTLFSSMSEGFALHEIICDEANEPIDYRFLEINEAFERQTELKRENVIGRTVLDVLPGNDPYWVEIYGKVALTGEPVHLEQYSSPLGRWYGVYAFSPIKGQFAVLFTDITERKHMEEELAQADRRKQELYDREHRIAESLQQAIVPVAMPSKIYDFSFGVQYRPALDEAEIGGDFYDVFDLGDGKVGIMIGDVAGKGLQAAIRVASARYAIRSYAYSDPTPSKVLAFTNEALYKFEGGEPSMLTALFVVMDNASRTVEYSCAGHEPPIVCRSGGLVEEMEYGGMPLGILGTSKYSDTCFKLDPGDTMVVITDGITEARAPGPVLYGNNRMIAYLSQHVNASPDDLASGLLEEATNHTGGKLQDDVAIVVVRLNGQDSGRN